MILTAHHCLRWLVQAGGHIRMGESRWTSSDASQLRRVYPMPTDRSVRTMVAVIAVIAIFAALTIASSVIAPVVCAIFIIALVWPMQSRLQRRMPKLIALAIVIAVIALVFVIFASLVSWAFGWIGQSVIANAGRFQTLYEEVTAWLEGHGVVVAGLWAEHFNMGWLLRTMQGVTARLNTTVTFWLVVLVYVVLGLLEVDDLKRRLLTLENRAAARLLLDGSVAIGEKFRRYMLIRTMMSLATGALVWALAALFGLQLAVEWGIIAFTLNYIPFIGPFVATVFPTLYALAQFASWQSALAIFVCLNIIQFVIGSYIEPRVAGSVLAISPFLVLFSVFLWTYVWGLFGAFIGVPIAIAILTLCAQHPSSRWVADVLGEGKQPQMDGKQG
jgi:predicted PurR-regulated permease PerM